MQSGVHLAGRKSMGRLHCLPRNRVRCSTIHRLRKFLLGFACYGFVESEIKALFFPISRQQLESGSFPVPANGVTLKGLLRRNLSNATNCSCVGANTLRSPS